MDVRTHNKLLRALGVLALSFGVLLGMMLSAVGVWGDFEATRFDASLSLLRDASLKTFRCPVLMTTKESGTVTGAFKNPLDRPITLTVRVHVSNYLTLTRESTDRLPLDPGETKRLQWTVTPDDVMYGDLILVKALQFRQYPLPGRLGSCGIVVVDLPYFTGAQLFTFAFAASLLGMLGGIWLWHIGSRPLIRRARQTIRTMSVLTGSVLVGLIVSILGWWMIGLLILALNILTIGAVIGHLLNGPTTN